MAKTFNYNGEELAIPETIAPLFKGFSVGPLKLSHNVVYAPLTRCRAFGTVPTERMSLYYAQRASRGGLMLSEGTVISEEGHGYPCTPGLHTEAQINAWKPVTAAVHAKGAKFFCQLWHVGRASHNEYQKDGAAPIGPSAIAITDPAWTVYGPAGSGPHPYPVPRALETSELPGVIASFVSAAKAALAAGFDGVEIHSANGYLLNTFLADGTNKRTDAYGGSIENRCRLTLEVAAAVAAAVGAEKVGIRLAPFNMFLQCNDSDPEALYSHLLSKLSELKLGYVHLIAPRQFEPSTAEELGKLSRLRKLFNGPAILAGGYDAASASAAIAAGDGDAVCFGRHYLSNPDLPKRFLLGAALNDYDREKFYSPQFPIEGFTDYPFLGQEKTVGVDAVDPYAVK